MPSHPSILPGVEYKLFYREETFHSETFRFLAGTSHEAVTAHQSGQLDLGNPEHRRIQDMSCMFAVVWPVVRSFCRALSGVDLQGKQVLEIGCGLGLGAMVAARKGGVVLATDVHPDALTLLQTNATSNQLTLQTALLDWRQPAPHALQSRFDVVIASDVLFAYDCGEDLVACLMTVLKPGGVALIADPKRPWLDDFVALAGERFVVEQRNIRGGCLVRLAR